MRSVLTSAAIKPASTCNPGLLRLRLPQPQQQRDPISRSYARLTDVKRFDEATETIELLKFEMWHYDVSPLEDFRQFPVRIQSRPSLIARIASVFILTASLAFASAIAAGLVVVLAQFVELARKGLN